MTNHDKALHALDDMHTIMVDTAEAGMPSSVEGMAISKSLEAVTWALLHVADEMSEHRSLTPVAQMGNSTS